jgi:hypothetical protein
VGLPVRFGFSKEGKSREQMRALAQCHLLYKREKEKVVYREE